VGDGRGGSGADFYRSTLNHEKVEAGGAAQHLPESLDDPRVEYPNVGCPGARLTDFVPVQQLHYQANRVSIDIKIHAPYEFYPGKALRKIFK
jgi:hypothetical protein